MSGPDEIVVEADGGEFRPASTSRAATASLVLGLASLVCSFLTGLPGIIVAIIALVNISGSRGRLRGTGFAVTGLVLSCLSMLCLPALLLPAVQMVREAARRNKSILQMKEIAIALSTYETQHGEYPRVGGNDPSGGSQLSWRVHMLPFFQETQLYNEFHLDEPWDSDHNRQLIARMPAVFRNPNGNLDDGYTNYLAVAGPGTLFPGDGARMSQVNVRDGTSNTIILVEADADQAVIWTQPDDWQFDPNDPIRGLGNYRPGHVFLAMRADGSSIAVASSIDPSILAAAFTIAGDEVVDFQ
jgi:hypothetical protein